MAKDGHIKCSNIIKDVHSSLRKLSLDIGCDEAWKKHRSEKSVLKSYASAMKQLGTTYWEENAADPTRQAQSRITWISDNCYKYFVDGDIAVRRSKELSECKRLQLMDLDECNFEKIVINVLDVGSCYNPFGACAFMNVMPIDLFPACPEVNSCDFLSVRVGNDLIIENAEVVQLQLKSYDVVVFCLLLEYLPSSNQRKICCEKAYDLLNSEGLLVIATPDSKHVGANAKIMKNWRYTLALMGFTRIKYEKMAFLHCMVFRKSLSREFAKRWALIHKEKYMNEEINIPQDFQDIGSNCTRLKVDKISDNSDTIALFEDLPDVDIFS